MFDGEAHLFDSKTVSEDDREHKRHSHIKHESCFMKVYGTGEVEAVPDTAIVKFAVLTENKDVQAAQQENARKTNQIINGLKQLGIPNEAIKTINYDVRPRYDYEDGKAIFRGYEVKHQLQVTIKNTENAGKALDLAASYGANVDYGIDFEVSQINAYYRKALQKAAMNAHKKAITISQSFGMSLNPVPYSVTELPRTLADGPIPLSAYKAEAASVTPVQAGEEKIIANLEVIYHYR